MADFPTAKTEAVDNTTDVLAKHINNIEDKVGIDSSADADSLDYRVGIVEDAVYTWKGAWVTATAYVLNDTIEEDGSGYVCIEAHTSGTFATDLAASKWELYVTGVDADSIASAIVGVAGKTTPIDADTVPLIDSADSNSLKELTLANLKIAVLKATYPVGSLYFNGAVSTNPNTLLGFGTWVLFGVGRVLVCRDSGYAPFDSTAETGGELTHTLITSEMPAHTHSQKFTTGSGTIQPGYAVGDSNVDTTGSTGGGGAHNNVQPYIVVNTWIRTV